MWMVRSLLTIADLVRGDLSDYEAELKAKTHDELVALVWQKLQGEAPGWQPAFRQVDPVHGHPLLRHALYQRAWLLCRSQ